GAVEFAFRRNDVGALAGQAFDLLGPFARRLERSLDRRGASIRRQCRVHGGKCAGTRQKRPEPIGEIGARHSVQPPRLPRHRFDQTRMAMSETDGRVGAHHVEIAATLLVPDMDALAADKSNGQRLVIRPPITGFEATELADRSLFSVTVAAIRSPINRAVRSARSRYGLYSTISTPMQSEPQVKSAQAARNSFARMAPGSGVPTPGASAGSKAS